MRGQHETWSRRTCGSLSDNLPRLLTCSLSETGVPSLSCRQVLHITLAHPEVIRVDDFRETNVTYEGLRTNGSKVLLFTSVRRGDIFESQRDARKTAVPMDTIRVLKAVGYTTREASVKRITIQIKKR